MRSNVTGHTPNKSRQWGPICQHKETSFVFNALQLRPSPRALTLQKVPQQGPVAKGINALQTNRPISSAGRSVIVIVPHSLCACPNALRSQDFFSSCLQQVHLPSVQVVLQGKGKGRVQTGQLDRPKFRRGTESTSSPNLSLSLSYQGPSCVHPWPIHTGPTTHHGTHDLGPA